MVVGAARRGQHRPDRHRTAGTTWGSRGTRTEVTNRQS